MSDKQREPSITSSAAPTLTGSSDTQYFTASGRPMPKQYSTGWTVAGHGQPEAGNHVPVKFKDTDKIMVPMAIPDEEGSEKRKSWFGKMNEKIRGKKQNVKIVEMTRGEYLAMMKEKEEKEGKNVEPTPEVKLVGASQTQ